MNQTLQHFGELLLGLGSEVKELHFYQIILRALVIFCALLIMIRLAGRRFLVNRNPLDILLSFLLASMLSRAINGSAPFVFTIGTGFFVVIFYRAVAYLACRFGAFGRLLKGTAQAVIEDGRVHKQTLERHHLSEDDLLEELRLNGNVNSPQEVKLAKIERNGAVSVITKASS